MSPIAYVTCLFIGLGVVGAVVVVVGEALVPRRPHTPTPDPAPAPPAVAPPAPAPAPAPTSEDALAAIGRFDIDTARLNAVLRYRRALAAVRAHDEQTPDPDGDVPEAFRRAMGGE